mgnify:CR=1 FL=1
MTHYHVFPFTAIVGQEKMKLALLLNAINPKIGGVLVKGTKGTAKSTAVRALADLLPELRIIKGCSFNCNPDNPKECCHACLEKIESGIVSDNDITTCQMEVVNLPINATEDRVVGTIDIKSALQGGTKVLSPGILAEANRNILYIDEVNLLADTVADVLLDSAAMGINIIEREGISVHHPSKFILIGTMNPEEGNIRPQLLDRFGLSVEAEKITDINERVKIISYSEQYHDDPEKFYHEFEDKQEELRERIINARKILSEVIVTQELLEKIAGICIAYGTEGHRADITINLASKTIAALNGRKTVEQDDIKKAAELALPHRLRRLPFEDEHFNEELLDDILNNASEEIEEKVEEDEMNEMQQPPERDNLIDNYQQQKMNLREEIFDIDTLIAPIKLKRDKRVREKSNSLGKVVSHPTDSPKGKYTSSRKKRNINVPTSSNVAILPTINEAARDPSNQQQMVQIEKLENSTITVSEEHLHIKSRIGKSSYLVIFCVDASGSMGVQERMKSVKGAIFSILQTNYINRDKVALIAFRGDKAEVVLPPTRSVDLAHKLLKEIPTGGTTPLVAGLSKALSLVDEEKRKDTGYIPLIVLLSDARGNVYREDAVEEMIKTGEKIAKQNLEMIIIDVESKDVKLGFAQKLADVTNAEYYHIDALNNQSIKDILALEQILPRK